MKKRLTIIAMLIFVVAGIIAPFNFQKVSAAQSRVILFPVMGTWYICQGYNTSEISHTGKDIYAFDLSPDKNSFSGTKGCNSTTKSAASGKNVYAPAGGTVTYLNSNPDIMQLKLNSGGCIRIAHFTKQVISPGTSVKQGALLGTLSAPNAANGYYAHLHISVYSDTACTLPVAFEEKSNFRIYGASNFPATTTKYAYRGKSISYQVPTPITITPTRTTTSTGTSTYTSTTTSTSTYAPTLTSTFTSTVTATFTASSTPAPSIPSDTPTAITTFTPTLTFESTDTFTPTATPSLTDTPAIPQEPIVIQPSLNPVYPDNCSSNNKWLAISNGYLALNTDLSTPDHTARWYPDFSVGGRYKVEVFIPNHSVITWTCNNAQITEDTSSAKYQIYYQGATSTVNTTVVVDQLPMSNDWVTLGTYSFGAHQIYNQYVKLTNITQEPNQTHTVSFGSIRFTYVGP